VSIKDVRAMVLGGHGDDMVPVLSMCTINGVPVTQLIAKDKLDAIVDRTRKGGGEIVNLMGTSAYYAPRERGDRHGRGLPPRPEAPPALRERTSTGEYGYKDLYMGVPVVIGGGGVEKIVEIPLTTRRRACSRRAPPRVQGIVDVVKKTPA
jgi:malate dehydrogenase